MIIHQFLRCFLQKKLGKKHSTSIRKKYVRSWSLPVMNLENIGNFQNNVLVFMIKNWKEVTQRSLIFQFSRTKQNFETFFRFRSLTTKKLLLKTQTQSKKPQRAEISVSFGNHSIGKMLYGKQNLAGDRLRSCLNLSAKMRKTRQICKEMINFESFLHRKQMFWLEDVLDSEFWHLSFFMVIYQLKATFYKKAEVFESQIEW